MDRRAHCVLPEGKVAQPVTALPTMLHDYGQVPDLVNMDRRAHCVLPEGKVAQQVTALPAM
jgi:hypothetical protein